MEPGRGEKEGRKRKGGKGKEEAVGGREGGETKNLKELEGERNTGTEGRREGGKK